MWVLLFKDVFVEDAGFLLSFKIFRNVVGGILLDNESSFYSFCSPCFRNKIMYIK